MSLAEPSVDQLRRTHASAAADRVSKHSSNSPPTRNSSASAAASSTTNSRSCVTCRRRKVKCDKRHPCTNCTKARIECTFPAPGRAPRKARKPPDAELLERLRKLEGVVRTLGGTAMAEEGAQMDAEESRAEPQQEPSAMEEDNGVEHDADESPCPKDAPGRYLPPEDTTVAGLETRFGRLVVDEGRSRYINSSFWASLNNEVEDIKELLMHSSDEEDDYPSPDSPSSNSQGYIFGYSSTNVDMLSLHPPPEHFQRIWILYKENVDPLLKVLHIPTTEPKILGAMENRNHIPKGMEALLFSIYYAVVTSQSSQDCQKMFGEDKHTLLAKYRFGLEQGLARANFLQTDEIIVLQAFVIFLICLRRNEDARIIWTLAGLVVRMAQTLGIHRDGSHFNLPPFEIEMRRRLWWQVCILDSRASEDHGCDPTIVEASFDTRMPLNVNDTDLDPAMTELPGERLGCTEMTFCLIRFEVANVYRRIQYVPPAPVSCSRYLSSVSLEQKERWITEVHSRIEERYLQHCDMTVPLYWVIATVSRLIMSKMWLMIYHPYQRLDGGASLPQETKDKLFVTSLENVEYSLLLETEARTEKWGWLFRTYVQWHAIAFLLSELCVRTKGELVDRSWRAVEATAARRWSDLNCDQKKGCLWRPLRKLVTRARAAREEELARDRAALLEAQMQVHVPGQEGFPDLSSAGALGMDLYPTLTRAGVSGSMPGGDGNAVADASTLNFSAGLSQSSFLEQQQQQQLQQNQPQGLDLMMDQQTQQPQTFDTFATIDWLLKDPSDPLPGTTTNTTDSSGSNGNRNTPSSGNINTNGTKSHSDLMGIPGGGTTSPVLGDDPVNWANWDDLVSQYGMDLEPTQGEQGNPGQGEQLFVPVRGFQTWY